MAMLGVWKKDVQWNNVEADFIIEDLKEGTGFSNRRVKKKWEVFRVRFLMNNYKT